MTESPSPLAERRGLLSRAIGVLVSPGATFRSVVAAPHLAGIMFVACVVIGLSAGAPQLTARGRQAALDLQVQQTERMTGQDVPPEVRARLERFGQYGAYLTMGAVFVFVPFKAMVLAAVYWAIFNGILAGTATFRQVLAVVVHAQIVPALGALAAAPIQYFSDAPNMTGPFTFGALAPMLAPDSFLASFLSSITLFTCWEIVVTAIGLAVLYRRRTTGIAAALFVAYLAIALTATSVISSFTHR